MKTACVCLVKFVGGPFDGFRQQIDDDVNQLPPRVAIPFNQRAARTLGLGSVPQIESPRTVIYRLELSSGLASYRFERTCPTQECETPARHPAQ